MIFYEVDMQGSNWLQRLSTTPGTSAGDGRFAFIEDINTFAYTEEELFEGSYWHPYFTFQKIGVSGQSDIQANLASDTLQFSPTGLTIITDPASKKLTFVAKNTIGKITIVGQPEILSIIPNDTLTFSVSANINISTNPATKTVTISGDPSIGYIASPSQSSISSDIPSDLLHISSSNLFFNTFPASKEIIVALGRNDNFFASGRKIWVNQSIAPAGWTIVADTTGNVVAIKSASGTYNVAGGTVAGTWSHPTHTHTGNNHNHTTFDHTHPMDTHVHATQYHTLTESELPAHVHEWDDMVSLPVGGNLGTGLQGQSRLVSRDAAGNKHTLPAPFNQTSSTMKNPDGSSPSSVGIPHWHNASTPNGATVTDPGGGGVVITHSSGTTSNNFGDTDLWRPLANQGIIISKD